ncbi:DnaD domain protein [Clostridium sp. BJN0001]|uniref:DnaD domain protein n=1 Tax=Clostridium sp. BJN0001 TaxID=2930219 RepID=UPI001FD4117E|nr:DnaD domain protein [Clostridium sp. BJN0001]
MLKNRFLDFTPVSNIFIEKYMVKARGEFVKVYLLLLKHTIFGEPGVNTQMLASSLNLLESDVMNALNYWNDETVIKFRKIDNLGNFSIEFLDLNEDFEKSNKNLDLLNELDNSNTKDMLKDIESLLGRPLSPNEMSMYLSWQKEFNFSSELIYILMEYCISRGKSDPRYIEKVAINWHDMNITTVEEAQNLIKRNEDKWVSIRKILAYLGLNDKQIMKPQQDMIEKWLFIYKFPLDVIYKACDICSERLNRADLKYIDGILSKWNKNNLKTIKDIALKDTRPQKPKNKNTNSKLKFNNFKPREYDYDELEKKLLGWDKDD